MRNEITNFKDIVVSVTPTMDTNAYASGDLLFEQTTVQVITAAPSGIAQGRGLIGRIKSIWALDEDDQGAAITLYFSTASSDFGTVNSAPSITDAVARDLFGHVDIAAADWKDLGANRVAFVNCDIPFKCAAGGREFYMAGVTGGSPTHSAAGLKFKIGVEVQEA